MIKFHGCIFICMHCACFHVDEDGTLELDIEIKSNLLDSGAETPVRSNQNVNKASSVLDLFSRLTVRPNNNQLQQPRKSLFDAVSMEAVLKMSDELRTLEDEVGEAVARKTKVIANQIVKQTLRSHNIDNTGLTQQNYDKNNTKQINTSKPQKKPQKKIKQATVHIRNIDNATDTAIESMFGVKKQMGQASSHHLYLSKHSLDDDIDKGMVFILPNMGDFSNFWFDIFW